MKKKSSFSPLITVENGDAPVKKLNGLVEGSSFDQILDLGTVPDSNKTQSVSPGLPPPLMAFEESIQQQNNNPTGAYEYFQLLFSVLAKQVLTDLVQSI